MSLGLAMTSTCWMPQRSSASQQHTQVLGPLKPSPRRPCAAEAAFVSLPGQESQEPLQGPNGASQRLRGRSEALVSKVVPSGRSVAIREMAAPPVARPVAKWRGGRSDTRPRASLRRRPSPTTGVREVPARGRDDGTEAGSRWLNSHSQKQSAEVSAKNCKYQ